MIVDAQSESAESLVYRFDFAFAYTTPPQLNVTFDQSQRSEPDTNYRKLQCGLF